MKRQRYATREEAHTVHKLVERGVYRLPVCSSKARGLQTEDWERVTCPLCLRLRGKDVARG